MATPVKNLPLTVPFLRASVRTPETLLTPSHKDTETSHRARPLTLDPRLS